MNHHHARMALRDIANRLIEIQRFSSVGAQIGDVACYHCAVSSGRTVCYWYGRPEQAGTAPTGQPSGAQPLFVRRVGLGEVNLLDREAIIGGSMAVRKEEPRRQEVVPRNWTMC